MVSVNDFCVVICGGGVAAIERLLRLRRLAGDRVHIKLLAPNANLVYRPLALAEPFGFGHAHRYDLGQIASDAGAEWVHDRLFRLDVTDRLVYTDIGETIPYDALLIAVGAKQSPAADHVTTLSETSAQAAFNDVVAGLEDGRCRRLAFILPDGPAWPLPLYEFALLTANCARDRGIDDAVLSLVTCEPEPMEAFGPPAGAVIRQRLRAAGIEVYTKALAYVPDPHLLLVQPHGVELEVDRIFSLPLMTGPGIGDSVGGGARGFIPIDRHCSVPGTDGRVFAAGDVTAFPIKHGGLGAQQADTAAAAIARLAGADTEDVVFEPVLHGKLLTGKAPIYLTGRITSGYTLEAEVYDSPPWPAEDKIVAEELGPYLRSLAPMT
jgi:sulfide:quinone oxidoreductase